MILHDYVPNNCERNDHSSTTQAASATGTPYGIKRRFTCST